MSCHLCKVLSRTAFLYKSAAHVNHSWQTLSAGPQDSVEVTEMKAHTHHRSRGALPMVAALLLSKFCTTEFLKYPIKK